MNGDEGNSIRGFVGIAEVNTDNERSVETGLARAIADAATQAYHGAPGMRDEYYELSRVQVRVGNPGPTAYRVIITPSG